MTEKTVMAKSGLEARTAALFVQLASQFASSVQIKINNKVANGKSIMGLISMGISDGQQLTIITDGSDELKAAADLVEFFGQ
ncbi:MAG: HPr family phosphocarrier protein [Clostridiales bacterium]|jgi:phosphotransferase system HPr (HPr) family protein|nr:HPr family phosphocarrier protein [Clostridiales bacterium]